MATFDKLALVNGQKSSWRVRVRVSRMWLSKSSNGEDVKGCNLILLDEDNYQVHAFAEADVWNNLANLIFERNVYVISHFCAKVTTRRLRPVRSNILIMFTKSTIVRRVVVNEAVIPIHKFEFSELRDLPHIFSSYSEDKSPLYAIDVIGVVQDLQKPTVVNTIYDEARLLRFTLSDGRFSIKVNIWDEHISDLDNLFHGDLQIPVVIIMASTRLCRSSGAIEIATLPSTKFFINEQNEHFRRFRQSIRQEVFEV